MTLPHVAVLLSSYNGGKYISALLDSLLQQDYLNFTIYIRDDGSSDGTLEILKRYEEHHPRIYLTIGSNLGCVASFLQLLSTVSADIYMFCDQDDIWLPKKISSATAALVEHGLNLPILFHSDLIVVDKDLATISNSFMNQQGLILPKAHSLEVLLIQNCVVGCTTAITNEFAKLVREVEPDLRLLAMHDWWMALLAKSYGKLIFSSNAEILYRQHEFNVSGAQKRSIWKKIRTQFSRSGLLRINAYKERVANQARAFLELHEEVLDDKAKFIIRKAMGIHPDQGFLATLSAIVAGIRFQNFYMNMALIYTTLVTSVLRFFLIKL